jgi:hypothetical protein
LKPSKAARHDGLSPGVLRILPEAWILFITHFLNIVFCAGYPLQWTISKMFTIFKKGSKALPANYRGISMLVALSKLYDNILNKRLSVWFRPDLEQAGTLEGRGCAEHLIALQLVIDTARKTKQDLYVAFIDYEKAYDRVDRNKLLEIMARNGCGKRFLTAICNSLQITQQIINTSKFGTTVGIRQGGATSCSLFTMYINDTIRAINQVGHDGYLQDLHCLLLMDDTIVFATSRQKLRTKLGLLKSATDVLNMKIHTSKSLFMCFGNPIKDTHPFMIDDIIISHTDRYVYLGNIITDEPIAKQAANNIVQKEQHIHKYASFLKNNDNAPFWVKNRVLESALNSSIFYGCESWLTANLATANTAHLKALKYLLGVRTQTCNVMVYAEANTPDAKSLIYKRQMDFIKKRMSKTDYVGSPLEKAIRSANSQNSPMSKHLKYVLTLDVNPAQTFRENIQHKVATASSSKLLMYKTMNPDLDYHPMYSTNSYIEEYKRVAVTRVRLGSHHLKIETGRWSRVPREERNCTCGRIVQDECHVLLHCPLSQHLRDANNILCTTLPELMNTDIHILAGYVFDVLNIYK